MLREPFCKKFLSNSFQKFLYLSNLAPSILLEDRGGAGWTEDPKVFEGGLGETFLQKVSLRYIYLILRGVYSLDSLTAPPFTAIIREIFTYFRGAIVGDKNSGGYLPCLMCEADVPVSRSEVGKAVYCSYCQVSLKLKQKQQKKKKDDDEELYFEEDY